MTPERLHKIQSVLAKRQNDITVILENVFDPHNVSAVMRSCDAVGIQEMYVLNTRIARHKNWGFKSSRSANKWLTVHQFEDTDQCVAVVRNKYEKVLATCLNNDAVDLYETDFTGKVALVFGNEQYGVSSELQALSDGSIIIPQVGMIHSLNISVACAVTLYEAYRQKMLAGHYSNQKLTGAEFNQLSQQWGLQNDESL